MWKKLGASVGIALSMLLGSGSVYAATSTYAATEKKVDDSDDAKGHGAMSAHADAEEKVDASDEAKEHFDSDKLGSSFNAATWMQDNMGLLGSKALKDITITGSHDSGMSVSNSKTLGAADCNTITQTNDILKQLNLGIRYFDVRPIIGGGDYYTGHYSNIGEDLGGQGARGQSIADLIDSVNGFTRNKQELVILNLSHSFYTDNREKSNNYSAFTQEQWDGLFTQLAGLKNLYIVDGTPPPDLTQKTLHDFIGNGSSAVVVIVQADAAPNGDPISLGTYAGQGFFPYSSFNAYNAYSDTNDFDTMAADQIAKMKEQKAAGIYFLLSWTLTQSSGDAVACAIPNSNPAPSSPRFMGPSILDLAQTANSGLLQNLIPNTNQDIFPNIIYIDGVGNLEFPLAARAAMNINQGFWSREKVEGAYANSSPSLAVFNDQLYMAFQGTGDEPQVWWARYDGTTWSREALSGAYANSSPSLAVFNDQLYMAFQGTNNQVWWLSFDGTIWSYAKQVVGALANSSPSVPVFNNQFSMAFQGTGGEPQVWWANYTKRGAGGEAEEAVNAGKSNCCDSCCCIM